MGVLFFNDCSCRWFDVMQKTSNQLRTNIANAARHRGDKVSFYFLPSLKLELKLMVYISLQI